jgi:hypothetical protein
MKKFKQLWYTGLFIVGIPVILIIIATFFAIASNLKKTTQPFEEEMEQPQIDTVIVEKRVIVRDTVYIKPKTKPLPVAPINDSI